MASPTIIDIFPSLFSSLEDKLSEDEDAEEIQKQYEQAYTNCTIDLGSKVKEHLQRVEKGMDAMIEQVPKYLDAVGKVNKNKYSWWKHPMFPSNGITTKLDTSIASASGDDEAILNDLKKANDKFMEGSRVRYAAMQSIIPQGHEARQAYLYNNPQFHGMCSDPKDPAKGSKFCEHESKECSDHLLSIIDKAVYPVSNRSWRGVLYAVTGRELLQNQCWDLAQGQGVAISIPEWEKLIKRAGRYLEADLGPFIDHSSTESEIDSSA